MSVEPKPRPLRHLWNTARVVGVIVTLTGFTPDRWMAAILDAVKLPDNLRDSLVGSFDPRFIAVGIGVAIIAVDAILRHRRQTPSISPGPAAPFADAAPSPTAPAVSTTALPMDGIEPVASKPSIAVLPFVNMSDDKNQEYFAEGIAEDIIVALSKLHSLFVIARNTSFAYRDNIGEGHNPGKDLGARYILRGSVRKIGERARITAQLVDTETDGQLWAERFDRELDDVFLVQDEITRKIISILPSRIEAADLKRVHNKPTANMAAYEYLLRGKFHHHLRTQSDNELAYRMLGLAIEADPGSAQAHAWRACVIGQAMVRGYRSVEDAVPEIFEDLKIALALDDEDFECHRVLSSVYSIQMNHERAEFHAARAYDLNPNDPRVLSQYGELLALTGKPEEGIEKLRQALLVDPYLPDDRLTNLGFAQFVARRYDDALNTFKKISSLSVKHHAYLAACHGQLGDRVSAERQAAEVHRLSPTFSADDFVRQAGYQYDVDRQHHVEALRKAGL
jgi:adenylate cyclase